MKINDSKVFDGKLGHGSNEEGLITCIYICPGYFVNRQFEKNGMQLHCCNRSLVHVATPNEASAYQQVPCVCVSSKEVTLVMAGLSTVTRRHQQSSSLLDRVKYSLSACANVATG